MTNASQAAFIDIIDVGELTPLFTVCSSHDCRLFKSSFFTGLAVRKLCCRHSYCDLHVDSGKTLLQSVHFCSLMEFKLHSAKSNFGQTNGIIDKLMVRVVHSGAVTAIAAGVELILYLLLSTTFVHDTP